MEASKANLERPRVIRQQEIHQKTQIFNVVRSIDLRPQGDEQSTINMRVQNTERNNLNQFTQNTWEVHTSDNVSSL